MITTTQAKEYAELSQAAYAYFDEGDFGGPGVALPNYEVPNTGGLAWVA